MSDDRDYRETREIIGQPRRKICIFCKHNTRTDTIDYTICKKYNKLMPVFMKMDDCKGFKEREYKNA